MGDPEACTEYFQRKATKWIAASGSVEDYILEKKKAGLVAEFRKDKDFVCVCELAHDIGELKLRGHVVESLDEMVDKEFGSLTKGEMNILIAAIAQACGFQTVGQKLVYAGIATAVAGGIIAALLAARKKQMADGKKRSGSKSRSSSD
jgi:hypothetical protein